MARDRARGKGRRGQRRPGADESDGDELRWLTTYGDVVTLVLAMFVLLYAISQVDVVKFEAFVQGLAVPFDNAAGRDGLLDASDSIVGQDDAAPEMPPDDRPPVTDLPAPAPPAPLAEVASSLEEALREAGLADLAEVAIVKDEVVVRIGSDDVLFATGSTAISPTGRTIIAAIAPTLAPLPNEVRVEGHTDDVPLHRGGYTNWNLSTDRAVAVVTQLYREHGLSQARLVATGYGEFRPLTPNDGARNRSRNRRVEIIVAADPRRPNIP